MFFKDKMSLLSYLIVKIVLFHFSTFLILPATIRVSAIKLFSAILLGGDGGGGAGGDIYIFGRYILLGAELVHFTDTVHFLTIFFF